MGTYIHNDKYTDKETDSYHIRDRGKISAIYTPNARWLPSKLAGGGSCHKVFCTGEALKECDKIDKSGDCTGHHGVDMWDFITKFCKGKLPPILIPPK